MTKEELKTATNDELIDELDYCGYDSYYGDYRDDIVSEIKKRMQEPVLDKIRAEIAEYGSIMVSYAITKDTKTDKGIEKLVNGVLKQAKEQVLEIIDKYKAESEETETWNGIHAQITAPKGTFERIFNDADDDNDI